MGIGGRSWRDNSSDETTVEVWRRIGTGSDTRLAVLPPNATIHIDDSVGPGATYTYRVRVIGPGGASDWSNEATWTIPALR
jgi:hypothetical protein